uniref:Uncharacterized protein n=1 Tax=Rhodotorula toruloides (strain NP11) TaxID=1130832 RepID=A0A7G8ZGG5_RHOT1|nr:hypothetical protein JR093_mgp19 [Rhodotorula toruloides]YP_009988040.1 hypothetical protein JR093_mgp05 [Rhodotorula toruloides]QNL17836.1 hypothetical protein [Rhodotorula toruloides]QNL17850.1 hypothetical protein [Rhodotorula toruloides]CAE5968174.1 hypothetical protein [Rhodotorula toruloides]CAE5968212.1 hypothetical protein [Rhodotorula toruloides]
MMQFAVYYTIFPATSLFTMSTPNVNLCRITRRIPSPLRGLCMYVVCCNNWPSRSYNTPYSPSTNLLLHVAISCVYYTIFPMVHQRGRARLRFNDVPPRHRH